MLMTYSDIFKYIKTVDEARQLANDIDAFLSSLFETQNQSLEKTLSSVGINTAKQLKEIMLNLKGKDKINNFLIGLKVNLQKFKVLKLSLAFESSENSIDNIFSWVLKNLGDGIILDIKTDKSLLGGAIIEFNGKYKDYSLKKALEETFGNKREEILSILK